MFLEVKMKALPWIVVGVAVGLGVILLLRLDEPKTESATGSDAVEVESAARKSYGWGTKTLVGGKPASIKGAIKETTGRVTDNNRVAAEGTAERVAGNVKDAAGQLGRAAALTIQDLNR
jgi:uncharacterized protein YjbJ (UPF0337 family)